MPYFLKFVDEQAGEKFVGWTFFFFLMLPEWTLFLKYIVQVLTEPSDLNELGSLPKPLN